MDLDAPWPVACEAAAGDAPLRVVRPLLGVARVDVAVYLEALGLTGEERAPRHDASNDDLSFSRNRVRHSVLPELEALNHRAAESLARFARARPPRRRGAGVVGGAPGGRPHDHRGDAIRLDRRQLAELPDAVALRLVRRAARAAGLSVDADQAQGVLGIAAGEARGWTWAAARCGRTPRRSGSARRGRMGRRAPHNASILTRSANSRGKSSQPWVWGS